jgi:hypothetical protein
VGNAIRIGNVLMLVAVLATPAMATGDVWHRFPATAGIGRCEGGQVVEQVDEGGSVTYAHATIVAACMTSATRADWVMLSTAQCGEPTRYKPGLCEGKPTKGPLVRIRQIARYAEDGLRSIRLPHATIGRGCTRTPSERDAKWSCQSLEDVSGLAHGVAAGRFRNAQGNYDIPLFGKTVELPLAFDRKVAVKAASPKAPAASPLPPVEPDYPHWMGDGKHIAYGPPETSAEAALNCVSPGRIDLWVFDPGKGPRPFKSFQGEIKGLGRTEQATFRVRSNEEGDSLIFSIPVEGLALASLSEGRDFVIQIPTGETVAVPGVGAEKAAASIKRACARPTQQVMPQTALPTMRMP